MIAVFRQGVFLAEMLKIAGDKRFAQHNYLVPGVIDIELTQHVIAAVLKQTADTVAPRGIARMAAVQVARGVGRDPLDKDAFALAGVVPAVIRTGFKYSVYYTAERIALEAEVYKAGLGHGDGLRLRYRFAQLLGKRLADLHRRFMQSARKAHRRARCIVAQLRVARRFDEQRVLIRIYPVNRLDGISQGRIYFLLKVTHAFSPPFSCSRNNSPLHR